MPTSSEQARQILQQEYEAMLRSRGDDLVLADMEPDARGMLIDEDWPEDRRELRTFLQRNLRYLENQRGYTSFDSVGSEPVANFYHRLATVRQRKGPYLGARLPHLNDVLQLQNAEIETWLEARQTRLPSTVLVRVYPTGDANASYVPAAPHGALILVNAGLMDLMFTTLKINLATAHGGSWGAPLLSPEQASMALAEAFNAYLYAGSSFLAWSLPRLPANREPPLGLALRRGEQFVMCHEYGHLIAGHLAPGRAERLTKEDELEADAIACAVMAECVEAETGRRRAQAATFLAGGIGAFFAVACAVELLEACLGLEPATSSKTHPAIQDRYNAVLDIHTVQFAEPALERSRLFWGWLMLKHIPNVIALLQEVNMVMRRPGRWSPR